MTTIFTIPKDRRLNLFDYLVYESDWHDYLRDVLDELERKRAALPTEENIVTFTRVAVMQALGECHHALSDVLRCVVQINTSHLIPPNLNIDVDSVLYQCVDVYIHIDHITQRLVMASGEWPTSWVER